MKLNAFLVLTILGLFLVFLVTPQIVMAVNRPASWPDQPSTAYFFLRESLQNSLRQKVGLNSGQFKLVQQIASEEADQLEALEITSRAILDEPDLSQKEIMHLLAMSRYNQQVGKAIQTAQSRLKTSLEPAAYERLAQWANTQWEQERLEYGKPVAGTTARSFKIYATRYDSGGAYTVALPDQCLKFANAGNHYCDDRGYQAGGNYSIFISYKKGVGVRVGESGPWNIDDNYWATLADPTPRRMFADLGLGMPEAQAAFYNGYNGGVDQFGRKVTAPYGIDLAREVSKDIGLQPGINDWVTISFMWTEGWGNGGGAAPPPPATGNTTPGTPVNVISPMQTSTPNPDGSIIHEVKSGQALWSIAIAYGVKIAQIQQLNQLSDSTVIIPGQKLVIFSAQASSTPSPAASPVQKTVMPSATASPVRTGISQATFIFRKSVTPTATQTAIPTLSPERKRSDPLLLIITLGAVVGAGMLVFGFLTQRRLP